MSIFTEQSKTIPAANIHSNLAWPIPRLSTVPTHESDQYEVLIVGAGPSGLSLNLLLARLGLPSASRLCIDARPEKVRTGHADGLHLRTMEVLKSLNLADEILRHGEWCSEHSVWKPDPVDPKLGIKRESVGPWDLGKARYDASVMACSQGRVEKIFEEDLIKYDLNSGIGRGMSLVSAKLDESNEEYPVVAEISDGTGTKEVRAKYIIGADGARSVVRKSFGINLEGSIADDVFGVIDFVAESDFPDFRRIGEIYNEQSAILLIPRERQANGQWLTRIYVPFITGTSDEAPNGELTVDEQKELEQSRRERKSKINPDTIMAKINEMFQPYHVNIKQGTEVQWWAAYQIGQRVAETLVVKDSKGHPRVFLAGDACHTHSPKAGQGMNIGIGDALDLSWKLAYVINGLAVDPLALLDTYAKDRLENANNLISMDKVWYKSRYTRQDGRKIQPNQVDMMKDMLAFICGVGIQYSDGYITEPTIVEGGPVVSQAYWDTVLRCGRRFPDTVVTRYASGVHWHLQDEVVIDGRYRVVVFTSTDLRDKSASAITKLCEGLLPTFPDDLVEGVVLIPLSHTDFAWTDIPECAKKTLEMQIYCNADAYKTYGIDPEKGAIVVVRPDQFVGAIVHLDEMEKAEAYLKRILVTR